MNSIHWLPQAKRLLDKKTWIMGYAAEDFPNDLRSIETLRDFGSSIDVYADFAFQIYGDGNINGRIDDQALQIAQSLGIVPLILYHNFNGRIFDPQPLHSILSSTSLQQHFIHNILNSLPPSAAGVHIDFEGVESNYRIPYSSFLESLSVTLHAKGLLLTIAVPAKRSEWEAPGYDFSEIGRICDSITLMTYDEHFSGGAAGPVASLPWMTQALDYAIKFIPREKILLGIPVYGYDWSNEPSRMIPMRDIPNLVTTTQARVLWSDPAVEPYFYFWKGREKHTVWFENEVSVKVRLGFLKSYRLRGIAIWRLGYETKRFWQVVNSKIKR